MTQLEKNSRVLAKYIPEPAVDLIAHWILEYDFKLKIKRERSTKLGDWRAPYNGSNHIITVNHNLNKYSFLITLVHEVAHLVTYNKHKRNVYPHGDEWKYEYKQLMRYFLLPEIFPTDVLLALQKHLLSPAASSCSDAGLLRVLKRYDEKAENTVFVENLPFGANFMFRGKMFVKKEKVRSRYHCREASRGTLYLFNALAEVERVEEKT